MLMTSNYITGLDQINPSMCMCHQPRGTHTVLSHCNRTRNVYIVSLYSSLHPWVYSYQGLKSKRS